MVHARVLQHDSSGGRGTHVGHTRTQAIGLVTFGDSQAAAWHKLTCAASWLMPCRKFKGAGCDEGAPAPGDATACTGRLNGERTPQGSCAWCDRWPRSVIIDLAVSTREMGEGDPAALEKGVANYGGRPHAPSTFGSLTLVNRC